MIHTITCLVCKIYRSVKDIDQSYSYIYPDFIVMICV